MSPWRQAFASPAGAVPPATKVDFARSQVVLVALGERSSGGCQIAERTRTTTCL